MKHNIFRVFALAAIIVAASSCSVMSSKTCLVEEAQYPVYVNELEINTDAPISITSSCVQLGPLVFGPKHFAENGDRSLIGADKVRSAALYKAIDGTDYDVIVAPTYTTTIKNYLIVKVQKTTLTGYGAKIVGVHKK